MELTLENLVNEIVKYEYIYYKFMMESKKLFGKESKDFKFWNAKWSVIYDLAKEFDLLAKLKR